MSPESLRSFWNGAVSCVLRSYLIIQNILLRESEPAYATAAQLDDLPCKSVSLSALETMGQVHPSCVWQTVEDFKHYIGTRVSGRWDQASGFSV